MHVLGLVFPPKLEGNQVARTQPQKLSKLVFFKRKGKDCLKIFKSKRIGLLQALGIANMQKNLQETPVRMQFNVSLNYNALSFYC